MKITPVVPRALAMTPLALMVLAGIWSQISVAESYFNPAFLSEDTALVADLTRFEKGSRQAPGEYRVDIWRNYEFIATEDVRFIDAADAHLGKSVQSGGLTPCIDIEWLHRFGVNFLGHPNLAKYKAGECIPMAEAIPGYEMTFDFAKLRLDVSLPQVSLINSARGYIPSDQWDEGIPAALVNYSFTGNRSTNSDNYYLSLQSGLNYGPWRLRNSGAWSYSAGDGSRSSRWTNISTYLQRAVIPLKGELVMGDSNSGTDVFDSLGFRGAYSARNLLILI